MGNAVSIVKLYKSGGVAQRSTSSRQQARSARIKEYFSGPDGSLQPVSVDLDATNMRVFRSGELACLFCVCTLDNRGSQWFLQGYNLVSLLQRMQTLPRFCWCLQCMYHKWCMHCCMLSHAGTGPRPPSSALPLGQVRAANPLKVTPVVVSPELEQSLLAVSHAQVRGS
jgi:hypothetical protein